MSKKNKSDIIDEVSKTTNYSRGIVKKIVNATLNNIILSLSQGDEVRLAGFGIFELKQRAARMGRNPHTKEPVPIPARKIPSFKAGWSLKETVTKTE